MTTIYNRVKFKSFSRLSEIDPVKKSEWSSWSEPVKTGEGGAPFQPPHPEVLTARISSIQFRIHRPAWRGEPVKHYIFELARDQGCAVLSTLDWDREDKVIVPVKSTFEPCTDFLHWDPMKGD